MNIETNLNVTSSIDGYGINSIAFEEILEGDASLLALTHHFGYTATVAESNIIFLADDVVLNYNGGIWKFYNTKNDSFFMSLDTKEEALISVVHPIKGSLHTMPVKLACALICTIVYHMLCDFYYKQEKYEDSDIYRKHFWKMRDFIFSYNDNQYTKKQNEEFLNELNCFF